MFNFIQELAPLEQAFWWVAIVASVIFIVQTLLTIFGSDFSDGINADFDGNLDHDAAPFQLFSFRNLINFLLGFGWAGVALFNTIKSPTFLIVIATLIGLGFVLLYFVMIKQILKLSEDNTFNYEALIGKNAEVYLTIPKDKTGYGKVLISYKGSQRELQAMTENETISSGNMVRVIRYENNILIVEKL